MQKFFTIIFILSAISLFGNNNTLSDSIQKDELIREPEIFDRAEVMPTFPGGALELMKFLSKNIRYPEIARENGLQGKVIIRFIVDIDGSIIEPIVLKDGIGGGCAEEAMRVISSMPKWIPGSQRGTPVKVYYVLPVTFKLNNDIPLKDNAVLSFESIPGTSKMEAAYPGGNVQLEFYKQEILNKIKKSKKEKDIKIVVKVSLIIDELGKICNPVIIESNTQEKKNNAIILEGIKNMPNWYPAMYNKKSIATNKIITFEY